MNAEQIEKAARERIAEIDREIAKLQAERVRLATMTTAPAAPALQPVYIYTTPWWWYPPPAQTTPFLHDWWTSPGITITTMTTSSPISVTTCTTDAVDISGMLTFGYNQILGSSGVGTSTVTFS